MTNFRKSAPKPAIAGAGAPNPKKGLISVVYADDVLSFPERDANGYKMVGNIVLKDGAVVHELYATPTSQKLGYTIEGDEDAEQIKQKVDATHPGDGDEINEFIANSLGQGYILVFGTNCGSRSNKVYGTPCNAMRLKNEFTDDKDGIKNAMTFEQLQGDRLVPGLYTGSLTFAQNTIVADAGALDLTPVNGNVYRLPATTVEEDVTISSMTIPSGQVVSLVGSGGTNPPVLNGGVQTGVTVLLKDNTEWVALKDAVISLRVFDAGTTTYLIEESRR